MTEYFSEETLSILYEKKYKDSKSKGLDKINCLNFNKGNELAIIHRKVIDSSYEFTPYLEVLKLKGRFKLPRLISVPTLRDRVTLLALKEYLHNKFPESVNRKLPNHYIKDLKHFLNASNSKENIHYIKLDIKNFYDRINRTILINILKEKKVDNTLIELIKKTISTPTIPASTKKNNYNGFLTNKGIPQGLAISNILAQIYLHEFDKDIKKRNFFYQRYVDDIIILNQGEITKYRNNNIEKSLNKLDLELNEEKTERNSLKKEFNFLSYSIGIKSISIAENNIEKFIKRIAGKFTWFRNNLNNPSLRPNWIKTEERLVEIFIEELNDSITGIISKDKNYGWLFYFSEMTDISLLFKLDKIIQSFFLSEKYFKTIPKNLKKLVRTYYVISYDKNKNYISNYDNYNSIKRKRDFLTFRGKLNPDIHYEDEEIKKMFEKYQNKQLQNVEKDIGYNYF
ncbi:reverse transcriptase/maturase family protein [Tenacibaculum caenipelagi]|uniref:Reverse transcriptase (RNA-dependent DNA polymerase) n=1 Tax=Tenacibaculum caenipelagi TaxID=1325435 RepID=A0A4R6TCK6_9FLAO|nr:reverse transcriptase/maturase family protein [Tenacibaculum caenipelagi]TDQ22667.1 reverse transcriptase (RNA-dependent DNA polymerase) [Tenacibaculum caenipelagi]